jgi:uncharacterized membrane protein YtjA (UPF0391 family)
MARTIEPQRLFGIRLERVNLGVRPVPQGGGPVAEVSGGAFNARTPEHDNRGGSASKAMIEVTVFVVIAAFIAGALGLTEFARGAATLIQVVFGVFLALALLLMLAASMGVSV